MSQHRAADCTQFALHDSSARLGTLMLSNGSLEEPKLEKTRGKMLKESSCKMIAPGRRVGVQQKSLSSRLSHTRHLARHYYVGPRQAKPRWEQMWQSFDLRGRLEEMSSSRKISQPRRQQEEAHCHKKQKSSFAKTINGRSNMRPLVPLLQMLPQLLLLMLLISADLSSVKCQASIQRSSDNQVYGCPYPGVGANCQVNIVAQAPAVPLLSTEYITDEYATLKPDTHASYKCDQGYELIGQETLTCLASGRWSANPPSCVTNIALGKPTNQSSTVKGGDSRNANDGKLNTQHDSKHCTETRVDQSPWWQIDLLQLYEIKSVRLLGRACCNPQLSLHDIEIRVGNSSTLQGNRLCAWYPANLDEGIARDFQCAHPIVGRFVSIQMVGIEGALSLCEVMIFSTKEFPSDRCDIQTTLAPSIAKLPTTTTSATTTLISTNGNGQFDSSQLVVFNRTCYEMQTATGGSFLVADTYCKARGGSLLHSITNLTQSFVGHQLDKIKSKLTSKLVWIGAKRKTSSNTPPTAITSNSASGLVAQDRPAPYMSGRSLSASLDEFSPDNLFSADQGLMFSGESSPIFNPRAIARTSLYQVSSGAGGSTSRGSQTFGLPSTSVSQPSNRSTEHAQRSLIISQPNQIASFFSPSIATPVNMNHQPNLLMPTANSQPPPPPASSPIIFLTPHAHRSLRPPSLASTPQSPPNSAPSSSQITWTQASSSLPNPSPAPQSNLSWRWVGDAPSETISSSVNAFLWAEDQPNNYNNQQDCIALDGGMKWLWNDVTCELDYLPWVCQYRPSTCGSPDRNENSTILELPSSSDAVTVQEPAYQFNRTITYACPVGHRMEGPRLRRCQYDGTWSGKAPRCQYVNCGPVSTLPIENGRLIYLNQSQTTYGSQVKYVCYEDYVLVGNDLRQCQSDGKWGGKQPYCAYKWCPVLQQISNGFLNVSSYSENSIASYQCNSGYKLIGNDTRQCLLGGKWTNQEPFCQYVECGQPKQIPNGSFHLINATTNYLSLASYSCNENYTMPGGQVKLVCSANNRWTGKEPQCSLIDCGQPQTNPGSSFTGDSFTVHSSVDYKCDPGFKETSGNLQRTCGLDGQWTGQPITCKYVDCGRVPGILKGEISYINGTTYLASQVAYECTAGNRLSGHRIRFCGPDGRWTVTSPKCEEVRCDAPSLPANGSAIYIGNDRSFKEQSFSVGVTVQYECDYGHVVKGSWSSRLCQANGDWSGEAPECKFVDCGNPPNIENGNYVLKHPPAGSVGLAVPVESTRRSSTSTDSSGASQTGTFTYYGTIAHYSCDANFKIQGPSHRECLETGQWRTPLPTCDPVQCPKPEHFDEFTQVSLVVRSSQDSQTATNGATAATSSEQVMPTKSIRLIANNQWINHDSGYAFGVGDKLHYSCGPGYELYGGPEFRTCTHYGQWSGSSTPRCRLIDCGRPSPIGQEGRFYLLNETTTFNSLVEYSCVRPFKLVEVKIRQTGNLIETLNAAQAGVTPTLTSLPIGVKVCANNGQWMPNDQQPRCVSAGHEADSAGGRFDGADNTLDGGRKLTGSTHTGGASSSIGSDNSNNNNQDDGEANNNLDIASSSNHHQHQAASTSLLAKVIIAICLMVMLALIILTLICIRSGKKPKQAHRASILASNGHPSVAAAAAAAMQLQLANGKGLQQQQQAVAAVHQAAASMLSNQNIYINGSAHKIFPGSMVAQGQAISMAQGSMAYGDAAGATAAMSQNQALMMTTTPQNSRAVGPMVTLGPVGVDPFPAGKSSSLGLNGLGSRGPAIVEHSMSVSASNMLDSYSRLSIDSEGQQQPSNKAIRHNPNGLVTFVSPAQQQNNRSSQVQMQQSTHTITPSQHQVSPKSISTSLSSSSSPSSSSSAHHTTATRLSVTDSGSSSSSSNRQNGIYQTAQQFSQPQQQPSPPSLPAHPPPSHRLQQHHKQLLKQNQQQQPSVNLQSQNQQQQLARALQTVTGGASHHYMEPTM